MKLTALRRSARGRRLAWIALLALLFQQFAVVAYACTLMQGGLDSTPVVAQMAEMADCDGMRVPPPPSPICEQHCNPETPTSADVRAGQVPPLALAPPLYALQDAPATAAFVQRHADIPFRRSDPPPTLLFCSLLI